MDRNRSYTTDDYEEEEYDNGPSYDEELDFDRDLEDEYEPDIWDNPDTYNDEEDFLEE